MSGTTMVALIVMSVMAAEIARSWFKHKSRSASDDELTKQLQAQQQQIDAQQQLIGNLKERIQTLEAIVTDKKYALEREFEKL